VKQISIKIVFSVLFLMLAMPSIAVKAVVTPAANKTTPASINTSTLSETQSCAIIVAGDRSDHVFQTQIMYGADQAYNVLVNDRGFLPSRVYYLGSTMSGHPNVNAISTWSNIQYAMTTWLNAHADASHGVVLYLFDHGGTGGMAIPGGTLYASDVNTWLNSAVTSRIIIVYEACESGSFISWLSAPNRIIVTSTDGGHSAWPSANWAYFSESFWGSIATGQTIGDSFVSGWYNVEKNGHYADQIPLVDDNHDYVGHTPQVVMVWLFPVAFLPNGGDGNDASNTLIQGYGGTLFTPIVHLKVAPYLFSKSSANAIPISVLLDNNTPIRKVMIRAFPPGWRPTPPPQPDNTTSGFKMVNDTGYMVMSLNETKKGSGNYTGTLTGVGSPLADGNYNISVYAFTDAGISAQAFIQANVNPNGVPPTETTPPAVAITLPQNGTTISGKLNVTAIGDDVQGLQRILLYMDGALVKNVSMPAFKPYPAVVDALDTTTIANGNHTFMAKAINIGGLTSTSTVMADVQNPTTPGPDYTIVYYIAFLGAGFIIGVLVGLLRFRKAGGSRIRESPTRPGNDSEITGGSSEKPIKGENVGFDTEMIKGDYKWIKMQDKWIKGEGVARTPNGDLITPMKAVSKPATGKTLKLQKGSSSLKGEYKELKSEYKPLNGELPEEGGE